MEILAQRTCLVKNTICPGIPCKCRRREGEGTYPAKHLNNMRTIIDVAPPSLYQQALLKYVKEELPSIHTNQSWFKYSICHSTTCKCGCNDEVKWFPTDSLWINVIDAAPASPYRKCLFKCITKELKPHQTEQLSYIHVWLGNYDGLIPLLLESNKPHMQEPIVWCH